MTHCEGEMAIVSNADAASPKCYKAETTHFPRRKRKKTQKLPLTCVHTAHSSIVIVSKWNEWNAGQPICYRSIYGWLVRYGVHYISRTHKICFYFSLSTCPRSTSTSSSTLKSFHFSLSLSLGLESRLAGSWLCFAICAYDGRSVGRMHVNGKWRPNKIESLDVSLPRIVLCFIFLLLLCSMCHWAVLSLPLMSMLIPHCSCLRSWFINIRWCDFAVCSFRRRPATRTRTESSRDWCGYGVFRVCLHNVMSSSRYSNSLNEHLPERDAMVRQLNSKRMLRQREAKESKNETGLNYALDLLRTDEHRWSGHTRAHRNFIYINGNCVERHEATTTKTETATTQFYDKMTFARSIVGYTEYRRVHLPVLIYFFIFFLLIQIWIQYYANIMGTRSKWFFRLHFPLCDRRRSLYFYIEKQINGRHGGHTVHTMCCIKFIWRVNVTHILCRIEWEALRDGDHFCCCEFNLRRID